MTDGDVFRPRKVLFLCTGNSCRSQMAEAILRHRGGDDFEVFSAGSHPAGFIYPLAVAAMKQLGIPMDEQYSKSWESYGETPFDVVITLCDAAAATACPAWHGTPLQVHWSLPDPASHPGSEDDRLQFTLRVADRLIAKIDGLRAIDWTVGERRVRRRLEFLGEI